MAAAENTPTAKYGKLLMLALPTSSNFMPLVSRISSLQSFGLLVSSVFIRPIPSLFSSFPSCECLLPFPPNLKFPLAPRSLDSARSTLNQKIPN